ncbi:MAG: DUF2244 domain-containing protein [Neomegalonema sp.]|nr:DUF2244 domain-containing protein [Neomegalonema sp.]
MQEMLAASDPDKEPDPVYRVTLWPHRSLSWRQFRIFMAIIAGMLTVPLIPFLGGTGLWVIALFLLADFLLLGGMILLTYRSGRLREQVSLWPDRLRIDRFEPNGAHLSWEANPHWIQIKLVETKRIPAYLMLSSSGKEVELGAFLTPEERRALALDLREKIQNLSTTG